MEKENVLEIEYQEVLDKVAVRIKYQNYEVLKRGKFYDEETEVESCFMPEYCKCDNKLFIQGNEKNKDGRILLVDKEDLEKILEIVKKINEKYGIPKRYRGENGEVYYFLNTKGEISGTVEEGISTDTHFFEQGNYFKTKEEAKKVKAELDKFWERVRNGGNV